MLDRLLSAFVAVSLALLIWLYARSRDQETLDHVPIPVEVALNAGQRDLYHLEVANPSEVLATFTGPPTRIREVRSLLQRDKLRVEIPFVVPSERLKENRIYETLLVESNHLETPPGVSTSLVTGRNQVRIVLHRLGEKRLRVRLDPRLANEVEASNIEPSTVMVRGPLEVLERTQSITTQPGALPSTTQSIVTLPLVRELEGREVECEPDYICVKLTGAPFKTYQVRDIPINFLTPPGFPYRPQSSGDRGGKVSVRVVGPSRDGAPHVLAFVDLTDYYLSDRYTRITSRPVKTEARVQFKLPRGCFLEDAATTTVPIELIPDATAGLPQLDMLRPEKP
jgi:hypothetical protein